MDKEQRLPPEYKKALDVIIHVLSQNIHKELKFLKVPKEIVKEGTIVCLTKDFKSRDIPSGANWRWNQVKARKVVRVQNCLGLYEIEFFKLMSRPIQSTPFKLWRFNITRLDNGLKKIRYRALWCERGKKRYCITNCFG